MWRVSTVATVSGVESVVVSLDESLQLPQMNAMANIEDQMKLFMQ